MTTWSEAKLRARLTADSRTRGALGLRVSVHDGVATGERRDRRLLVLRVPGGGLHAERLAHEVFFPVCAPAIQDGPDPLRRPADLARRTLLVVTGAPEGWGEWLAAAEEAGFDYVWTFDSHLLWQEPFVIYSAILAATQRVIVGPMVTNPGTRDWTVIASQFATLNEMFGNRTICGIGRGDSALRTLGAKPGTIDQIKKDGVPYEVRKVPARPLQQVAGRRILQSQ